VGLFFSPVTTRGKRIIKELNDMEVIQQYQVKMSTRCAALKNSTDGDDVGIDRGWEDITEIIKSSVTGNLRLLGV
jgi:hypothetical protein